MDNLEFRTTSDSIEWRSEDTSWTTLVYLKDIRGRIGDTGPAGPEGPEGRRIELHTSPTHLQWGYADEGVWYNVVSLASLQGPKGEPGTDGKDGKDGEIGPQGPRGLMGPTGAQGERGIQGPKGERGQIGTEGRNGKDGKDGRDGEQGPKGDKGDKGDVGPQGAAGPKGEKGDKPKLGTDYFVISGPAGPPGDMGPKGDHGDTGNTRIVIDSTTEYSDDRTILCNKPTAMSVSLRFASGSQRIVEIDNKGAGNVTVIPYSTDTIEGETTQTVRTDCCMVIKDVAIGEWRIK